MTVDLSGLGRRFAANEKDHNFLIPSITPAVTMRTWISPGILDQGGTAQCVAYSGIKYLTSAPVMNRPKETPEVIYRECLLNDEWPGEDWNGGTSVRALFKVLKKFGYVSEY